MKKSLLSLAVITALSSTALVADVRVSGFMNVIGGVNDVDPSKSGGYLVDGVGAMNPNYNGDKISGSYQGYDDKYDFQNESLAAIQVSGNIAENMNATIQLIAQNQAVGDNIRMEWGFVSYDATDEVRILAGRIRPSLFLYSDYLDVGYAYNWVTPPSEVYDQVAISNLDGASVAYNLELGDNILTTTVFGGNSTDDKVSPISGATLDLSFDSIIGAELALSNDYGKIRAGYIQAKVSESNTNIPTTPDELKMNESASAFYGVGINGDYEDFHVAAEYIVRDMDETAMPDVSAYYAMLGYSIGDFTPSYTYAVADSDFERSANAAPATAGKVNVMRAASLDDRTSHTIGVRYEVNAQAALKLEWNGATVTHSDMRTGSMIETDEDINTMRIALNVIF